MKRTTDTPWHDVFPLTGPEWKTPHKQERYSPMDRSESIPVLFNPFNSVQFMKERRSVQFSPDTASLYTWKPYPIPRVWVRCTVGAQKWIWLFRKNAISLSFSMIAGMESRVLLRLLVWDGWRAGRLGEREKTNQPGNLITYAIIPWSIFTAAARPRKQRAEGRSTQWVNQRSRTQAGFHQQTELGEAAGEIEIDWIWFMANRDIPVPIPIPDTSIYQYSLLYRSRL